MTWIKTTDALPDVGQQVLVARGEYVTATDLTRGWGKNANKVYWRGCAGLPVSHFTHWMPLPSAPRTAPNTTDKPINAAPTVDRPRQLPSCETGGAT